MSTNPKNIELYTQLMLQIQYNNNRYLLVSLYSKLKLHLDFNVLVLSFVWNMLYYVIRSSVKFIYK